MFLHCLHFLLRIWYSFQLPLVRLVHLITERIRLSGLISSFLNVFAPASYTNQNMPSAITSRNLQRRTTLPNGLLKSAHGTMYVLCTFFLLTLRLAVDYLPCAGCLCGKLCEWVTAQPSELSVVFFLSESVPLITLLFTLLVLPASLNQASLTQFASIATDVSYLTSSSYFSPKA